MKLQDRLENTSSSHSTNSKKLEEVQRDYDNLRQLHDEREKLYTSLKEESAGTAAALAHATSELESAKSELSALELELSLAQNHEKQLEEAATQSSEAYAQLQKEAAAREHALEGAVERVEEEKRGLLERLAQAEQAALSYLTAETKRCVIKSKAAQAGNIELNVEVRLKSEDTSFVNGLAATPGVSSAVLVSYNGDYMG